MKKFLDRFNKKAQRRRRMRNIALGIGGALAVIGGGVFTAFTLMANKEEA